MSPVGSSNIVVPLFFCPLVVTSLTPSAFNVSISTIQNAKKCNFDYAAYKEFVDGQFKQWRLSKIDPLTKLKIKNEATIPNIKAVTAVSDARMDWIIDKLADIEIRLRTLELNSK